MKKLLATKTRGRKPDPLRDAEILEVALSVLVETGYDGMTIDLVAAKAKAGKGTMYRRWASKEILVADAVEHMKRQQVDLSNLADTGSLRGDLLALFKPESIASAQRKLKVMSALSHITPAAEESGTLANNALVQPWVEANVIIIKRAIERGEINELVDISLVSQIIPSMAAYRALVLRRPFDKKFLIEVVDNVLMPALKMNIKTIVKSKGIKNAR